MGYNWLMIKTYLEGEEFLFLGEKYKLKFGNFKTILVLDGYLYFPQFLTFRIQKELRLCGILLPHGGDLCNIRATWRGRADHQPVMRRTHGLCGHHVRVWGEVPVLAQPHAAPTGMRATARTCEAARYCLAISAESPPNHQPCAPPDQPG